MTTQNNGRVPETIKAVIIRCPSTASPTDTTSNNRSYQSLPIAPLETTLHASDPPLSIPTLVSLPLWSRPHAWTGPHGDQRKPLSEQTLPNPIAAPLFFNADTSSRNFGRPSSSSSSSPAVTVVKGDRLFARTDGKDLTVHHLGCLVSFCESVMREFWRETERVEAEQAKAATTTTTARKRGKWGMSREKERAARMRRLACKGEFEAYWVRWCGRRFEASGMEEWLGLGGPFDV